MLLPRVHISDYALNLLAPYTDWYAAEVAPTERAQPPYNRGSGRVLLSLFREGIGTPLTRDFGPGTVSRAMEGKRPEGPLHRRCSALLYIPSRVPQMPRC